MQYPGDFADWEDMGVLLRACRVERVRRVPRVVHTFK